MFRRNKQPSVDRPVSKPLDEQTMLENVFKVRHSLSQDHPHYTPSLSEMVSHMDRKPPTHTLPDMATSDGGKARSMKVQGWKTLDDTHKQSVISAYSSLVTERRNHKAQLEGDLIAGRVHHQAYRDRIKDKTITPKAMVDHLNAQTRQGDPQWSATFDQDKQYSVLRRGGTEVGRFLHGENAFDKQISQGTARDTFRKQWDGLRSDQGAQKEFVRDDFENFTRRYAYRIDTQDFFTQIQQGNQAFTGKHFRNRKTSGNSTPDFLHMSPFEAKLSGKIGQQQLNALESTETGKRTVLSNGMLNDNAALFYHQFLGNNDSQRGASLTSTARGIVGNSGEGFGVNNDGNQRVKFKLDLAMVRKRKTGEAPNLFNYGASAMGSKVLDPTNLTQGRPYDFESSVTKNREVFLKQIDRSVVVNTVQMQPLDTHVSGNGNHGNNGGRGGRGGQGGGRGGQGGGRGGQGGGQRGGQGGGQRGGQHGGQGGGQRGGQGGGRGGQGGGRGGQGGQGGGRGGQGGGQGGGRGGQSGGRGGQGGGRGGQGGGRGGRGGQGSRR